MARGKMQMVTSVIGGLTVLFLGSLAFNAASNQERWPGALDLVRTNPWITVVLLVPLAAWLLWLSAGAAARGHRSVRRAPLLPAKTFRMPPRNLLFTGRDAALHELRSALTSHRSVTVQAIEGMGGVGKTQLAIEYAYRYLHKYAFVAFIDAERLELISSQFVALANALGVPDPVAEQAVTAVYRALAIRSPWLVIFDNAGEDFPPQQLLPSGETADGHVIVTTRHRGWASRGSVLELDVFEDQEAVTLLRERVPEIHSRSAHRIAEMLGNLPLAITQAAAYLRYTGMPAGEYASLLTNQIEAMIERGDVTDRPGVVVATLWSLHLRGLEEAHPPAVALLQVCAMLAPEPIPLHLFTRHPGVLPEPLQRSARDPVRWNDTIGAVVGRSLARRHGDRLLVHRLVRAAIRRDMPEEARAATHELACRLLAAEAPPDVRDHPTRWQIWQDLLPHVFAVVEQGPVPGAATEVAVILRVSACCVRNMGDPVTAHPLAERALAIDEQLYGRQHPRVAEDLHILGQALRDLGRPAEARPLVERAREIHDRWYQPGDRASAQDLAQDLALLALIVRDLGEPEVALPLVERAHEIDLAVHGPSHGYIADDLTTLARIRQDLGDPRAARDLAERALAIDTRLYGPNHAYVGIDSTILANILHDLGDLAASREMAATATAIFQARPGTDYRWTEEDKTLLRKLYPEGWTTP